MEYTSRTYRQSMAKTSRFKTFISKYHETDLMIGVSPECYRKEMQEYAYLTARQLRHELEIYIEQNDDFLRSLVPVHAKFPSPDIVREMGRAASLAGTGPMAAVAGAFAERVGRELKSQFEIRELWVENGGDIFIDICEPAVMGIFAGESPISGKLGFEIASGSWGICTSSATVGPSLSFGNTDAAMIISQNASIADALASKYGNMVHSADDLGNAISMAKEDKNVVSAALIVGNKIAICGKNRVVAI